MLKFRVLRIGNTLLLGLTVLMGSVFFLSRSALGDMDRFGTDCPPDWSNTNGSCYQEKVYQDTHQTSCATDYSGRKCCTYEGYKVVCSEDNYLLGYAYSLNKAGQYGHCDSTTSRCVLS
jgi:hypothetical protein